MPQHVDEIASLGKAAAQCLIGVAIAEMADNIAPQTSVDDSNDIGQFEHVCEERIVVDAGAVVMGRDGAQRVFRQPAGEPLCCEQTVLARIVV
jgi:hypothetical protein